FEVDGHVALCPAEIAFDARGGGSIAKAVAVVKLLDGIAVASEEIFAEPATAIDKAAGGQDVQALADGERIEVMIAGDLEMDEFETLAAVDRVVDAFLLLAHLGDVVVDFGVEVTARLKVLRDLPGAFGEQILIDGFLLKDGDEIAQAA